MIESPLPIPVSAIASLAVESESPCQPVAVASSAAPVAPPGKSPATPAKYFRTKRKVDWVITALLTLMAIPIVAIVAVLVLVCDGRPIFYRQVRVGKDGRLFRILKFRTMRLHAERHTGAVWSTPTDPRVSRLGRWLRCSHLDELPQFINVLAGEMSLVGPRPERPEFVERLAAEVPGYMQRTTVRPGITGLAQLRLGYDESIVGIPQKVACDLQYICRASFRLDLQLLLSTLPHIAGQIYFKRRANRQSDASDESAKRRKQINDRTRNVA